VRLGYGDFRFPLVSGSDFTGILGDLSLEFRSASDRIQVKILGTKRPYASFFFNNTYYVHANLGLDVVAKIRPRLILGGRARAGVSEYGDPLVNQGDPQEGLVRRDRIRSMELYGRMMLSPLMGITLSARGARRTSNYEGVEYDAKSLFMGMVFGWY
jgi:hypothetical protein